jgi:hypothetical protein
VKASFEVALAIAGVCLAGRAGAQTVVVGPQAGSMALPRGARVTVPIVADLSGSGGASLGSTTARLTWRPGVLAYLGATGGALGQPTLNADSAGGSLRFAVANPAGATGQPVLLSASFAVVGAAGAEDTLQLQLQELTASGTFADLLPAGVVTPSHLCVSTGAFGDLNGDTTVTSFDALLMITSAVGLPIAPYTIVNGDVDADGQVTTRDALIALSYAIALPVGGFRVGRLNPGTCSVQTAASVQIAPRGASVAVGDRFPLTATVRDSGGALVQGVDLVWTSADTAVVKADATGHLVGARSGTALVFAFAAPGLRDSATVTVDSLRHVWWVNPALAALNGGVELGSSLYPFSSIAQATARAAAADSVMVAPGTYGETVRFARPLTLVGDSTAAGVTTLRNPTGPGIAVDSLPGGGLVRIDRLRIEDSQGGVLVHGNGAGVVSMARLAVTQSTGAGVSVRNVARLALDQVAVDGAVQLGIGADSVPQVRLHAVGVDALTGAANASARPIALRVAGADSLVADSLQVGTAGVWVDSAHVASFAFFRAIGPAGAALAGRIATAFALDDGDIQGTGQYDPTLGDTVPVVALLLGGSATARIALTAIRNSARLPLYVSGGDSLLLSGLDIQNTQPSQGAQGTAVLQGLRRVVVQGSSFLDNGGATVEFTNIGGPMQVTVDTSAFRATPLQGSRLARFDLQRSSFQGGNQTFFQAAYVDTLVLRRVDLGGLAGLPDNSPDGGPPAVSLVAVDSASLDSVTIHDNLFGAVACSSCRAIAIARSRFLRNGTYGGTINVGQITNVALIATLRASLYGVSLDGSGHAGLWLGAAGIGSRTVVDSSDLAGPQYVIRAEASGNAGSGDTLLVTRSSLRGHGANSATGVSAYTALTGLTVSGSAFDSLFTGVDVEYSTGPATVYANRFTALAQGAFHGYYTGPVLFDSNAVSTVAVCTNGGAAVDLYATTATISRNAISGCVMGVSSGDYINTRRLAIVGNTIARDSATPGEGVVITDSYDSVAVVGNTISGGQGFGLQLFGSYNGIGAARVDSNTVRAIHGTGISIGGTIVQPVSMTYNVVADNDTDGIRTLVPLAASANTVVRNGRYGLEVNTIGSTFFRSSNFVGNVQYGVWNDDPAYFVYADTSYFGSPIGPSCTSGCNPGAGDSITVGVYFAPYSSSLAAGAPPLPLPAPPFRAAASPPALVPATGDAQPGERPRPSAAVQPGRVRP